MNYKEYFLLSELVGQNSKLVNKESRQVLIVCNNPYSPKPNIYFYFIYFFQFYFMGMSP